MLKNKPTENFLLDTHIWIWFLEGAPNLNASNRKRMESACEFGQVFVSAISVWEIAMLESKGRISINQDCMTWVNNALHGKGISLIPLEPEIAVESTRLPGEFHGDPTDRIIVATARTKNFKLLTADVSILKYAKSNRSVQTLAL